jgi:hypothetical protein
VPTFLGIKWENLFFWLIKGKENEFHYNEQVVWEGNALPRLCKDVVTCRVMITYVDWRLILEAKGPSIVTLHIATQIKPNACMRKSWSDTMLG